MNISQETYMREAIALSIKSVEEGGGPFGAVIVDLKTGEIIGRGKNCVTVHSDPTAHGEIEAIRDAGKRTKRTELTACALYTSAEPCPGCMIETLFNAGITEIYYGNSIADAAVIGFADEKNWTVLQTSASELIDKVGGTFKQLLRDEAQAGFNAWTEKKDKVEYYTS